MEKLDCISRDIVWGEEDKLFNIELANFAVSVGAIINTPYGSSTTPPLLD
jgi:hypothetical protein